VFLVQANIYQYQLQQEMESIGTPSLRITEVKLLIHNIPNDLIEDLYLNLKMELESTA